jgi:hypothetical protein
MVSKLRITTSVPISGMASIASSQGTVSPRGACVPATALERKGRSVLLGRYFLFVGTVLLALLLVADWYLPSPSPMESFGAPIDSAMIHVRSQHKWPQRLQFDTSTPSGLPPTAPAVAATAPIDTAPDPKLNAMAEVRSSDRPTPAKPKPHVAPRHRYSMPPPSPTQFAVNPWPQSW